MRKGVCSDVAREDWAWILDTDLVSELESEGSRRMNAGRSRLFVGMAVCAWMLCLSATCGAVTIKEVKPGEDVFAYIQRVKGGFDQTLYRQVIGASNAFKEGDQTIGVGAHDEKSR